MSESTIVERKDASSKDASTKSRAKTNAAAITTKESASDTSWENPMLAHVGGFESAEDDIKYFVSNETIKGKIPESVRGTFMRVVPGRNKLGGQKFGHWFDGDGCVHMATFTDQGVDYKHKFVRTPKYIDETEKQRITKRSIGHNAPGGPLKNAFRLPQNCANTNVIYHADKLLALWEGGLPYRLDPATLDTIGPERYDNKLGRMGRFSAHASYDPQDKSMYNFGMGVGLKGPQVEIYKISPGGFLVQKGLIPQKRQSFLHDFAMSKNYLVFMVSPYSMEEAMRPMLGLTTFDQCLNYRAEFGMECFVVEKKSLSVVMQFEVDPFLVFHFSNSWEEGDDIIVDLAHLGQPNTDENFAQNIFTESLTKEDFGPLWRFRINLRTHKVTDHQLPCEITGEFPQWDHRRSGEQTRYIYNSGIIENGTAGFFNAIQRIDLKTEQVQVHDLGAGRFTSEVAFVPDKSSNAEEKGHLLSVVYDAHTHRSEILILNAEDLHDVVANVPLENHIPHGFHGTYTSQLRG